MKLETAWEAGRLGSSGGPSRLLFGRMYEDAGIERAAFEGKSRVFCIASAGSTAFMAGFFNDTPSPFAAVAGLGDAEDAPRTDHLTASSASGANLGVRPRFLSAALASLASVQFGHTNFLVAALGGFFQRYL